MKTKPEAEHTPTQWRLLKRADKLEMFVIVSKDGIRIAEVFEKGVAEKICRAVNSHNQLWWALNNLLHDRCLLSEEHARKALAQAEGKDKANETL